MKIKLKPLRKAVLTVGEQEVEVERLGKGRYTTAWLNCSNVYLQTHEKDLSKELLVQVKGLRHLPDIQFLGDMQAPWKLYKEPKYTPLMASAKGAWEDFKYLKGAMETAHKLASSRCPYPRFPDAHDLNGALIETLEGDPQCPSKILDAISTLVDECANYGQYCIEITKKNCAVGMDGELILLDPCFDLQEVRDDRDKRIMKRSRGWL